ncbi:hypothetical protein ACFY1A_48265 [Streptomyces sp. NPDC001520]|uniref:hypothetical protein n=1 Tax=Streptomyces sp. NPDC001520 TaxID=3364581 RepID=UPI0036A01FD5
MHSIAFVINAHSAPISLMAAGADTAPGGDAQTPAWMVYVVAAAALALVGGAFGGNPATRQQRRLMRAMGYGGGGAIGALFRGLGGLLGLLGRSAAFVGRFLAGREMWGQPRSDATWWTAGTTMINASPVAELGAVAVAGPAPVAGPMAVRIRARAKSAKGAVVRVLLTAVAAVGASLGVVGGGLKQWHRWRYAARSAARVAALAAVWGLNTHTRPTVAVLAVTVPAGLVLAAWRGLKPLTDAQKYLPGLWPALVQVLHLTTEQQKWGHAYWVAFPDDLSPKDASITMRLPLEFLGGEIDRATVAEVVRTRVPGEWVARWELKGAEHWVQFTHKPAPKPKPECPERVGFFDTDIQAAIAECKKGEVVIGKDAFGKIIVKELGDGETPHWALSVGTGGGKSAFNQMVIAQLIRQGYHIIAVDVKRVSVENYKEVPGVHIYNDPKNPQDMRRAIDWFKDEIDARTAVKEERRGTEFPGLLLIIEEANEFADISKDWWDDNRKARADEFGPAERAADPIWGTVASGARLGRFVHGNILAVFQDLRDQALGGKGLRNLFRLKFMGNFNSNQWKNVIGTTPVPDSVDKAGRMMIVEGNSEYWVQTCFAEPEELTAWAIQQRQATGFDPAAGLFGTPPQRSARRLPRLLEGLSRDTGADGPTGAPEGVSDGITAGGRVTDDASVTASEGGRDSQRDTPEDPRLRFRLIKGEGGSAAPAEAADDAAELLPLAEISRRLEERGIHVKPDLMRQHKRRHPDSFPKGTGEPGKEQYTVGEILAYYQKKKNA